MFAVSMKQMMTVVKASDALGLTLPPVDQAGSTDLTQVVWYDEGLFEHVCVTISRDGVIESLWVTKLDPDDFALIHANPARVVDIFEAHQLPLGANVVNGVVTEEMLAPVLPQPVSAAKVVGN